MSLKHCYDKKIKVVLQPSDAAGVHVESVFLSEYFEPVTTNQSVRLDIDFELEAE